MLDKEHRNRMFSNTNEWETTQKYSQTEIYFRKWYKWNCKYL